MSFSPRCAILRHSDNVRCQGLGQCYVVGLKMFERQVFKQIHFTHDENYCAVLNKVTTEAMFDDPCGARSSVRATILQKRGGELRVDV